LHKEMGNATEVHRKLAIL